MPRADTTGRTMLSTREWRVVRIGALVSVVALLVAYGALPFARRWRAREAQLSAETDRLARLTALVQHRTEIDSATASREQFLGMQPRRVVRARSRALAASALQSLLHDFADASNITISRLDVAAATLSGDAPRASTDSLADGDGEALPVTLSAVGDVYGLAALLDRIRTGPRVVIVDRILVQVNSALRGAPDVLQVTLSLHAPVIVE